MFQTEVEIELQKEQSNQMEMGREDVSSTPTGRIGLVSISRTKAYINSP
jgi:hypothetical protein